MKRNLFCIAIIVMMFGCNADRKEYASEKASVDMALTDSATDSIATPKIIKTADMRFRVKDVQQTKELLSATIKAQGGTVAEFSITSTIQETNKVKFSTDSLKEITSYRKEGLLVAKVPSEKLDEFTNIVAKMAVFVDSQSMKMDDQSMAYLANKLKTQNRSEALKTINQTAKRKGNNVETSLYIKDDYVDKKIENMNIDSRVKLSTITLNFYQDNTVKTLIVGNDNLYDYRPGFFQRLGLNLIDGWVYFKEFILAISNLWMLLVFGLGVFFGIRYYLRNRKR
jgi:histidinol phosphatase-like enzyme